ncbi:SDR family NAD(P)-dependent oxidoreductase [Thermonema rossianum]|uniref:SDR family NAD(P)-dependent oxidoreductase n=1 Tax=Thermonema rossianum TaxID=55505 RepID=UPI00068C1C4F|nr:SDR family NAD(P)-dependent oxidoreductase [Thermonema rossianum]
MEKSYALITGASQGIGLAIAHELAARGVSLLLVALPDVHLEQSCAELKRKYPHIDVQALPADLTREEDIRAVAERCYREQWRLRYLINNASMGFTGPYESYSYEFYEKVLHLNVMATARLTRLLLPLLRDHTPAYILNMASMAAYFQMPYKVLYSSSKAFVYHFSLALREELRGSGVSVTVVCPGGVLTNPDVRRTIERLGRLGAAFSLEPQQVARSAVRAMLQGKSEHVPGFWVAMYARLRHLFPKGWIRRALGWVFRRKFAEKTYKRA